MGLGRYNLTQYNIGDTSAFYPVSISADAVANALFGAGISYSAGFMASSAMSAQASLGRGYILDLRARSELSASAKIRGSMVAYVKASAELIVMQSISSRVTPKLSLLQDLDALFDGFCVARPKFKASSALTAVMSVKNCIVKKIEAETSLSMQVSGDVTVDTVMTFDGLTIPAGKTLVIDTENCTAVLDGTNVIRYYEGDWPWIRRLLKRIAVESTTSGSLDVQVIYRERYL